MVWSCRLLQRTFRLIYTNFRLHEDRFDRGPESAEPDPKILLLLQISVVALLRPPLRSSIAQFVARSAPRQRSQHHSYSASRDATTAIMRFIVRLDITEVYAVLMSLSGVLVLLKDRFETKNI